LSSRDSAESTESYVRRLARDNAHRHILDEQFEYGHRKVADVGLVGANDPQSWKTISLTGLHLRDRARRWLGKLKQKAENAREAREARRKKKQKEASSSGGSSSGSSGGGTGGTGGAAAAEAGVDSKGAGQPGAVFRYKYPDHVNSRSMHVHSGAAVVRAWLGFEALDMTDAEAQAAAATAEAEEATAAAAAAAAVSARGLLVPPLQLFDGAELAPPVLPPADKVLAGVAGLRKLKAAMLGHDTLPVHIGTLFLNDLHRVREFVEETGDEVGLL
jgi:hypothetical protein